MVLPLLMLKTVPFLLILILMLLFFRSKLFLIYLVLMMISYILGLVILVMVENCRLLVVSLYMGSIQYIVLLSLHVILFCIVSFTMSKVWILKWFVIFSVLISLFPSRLGSFGYLWQLLQLSYLGFKIIVISVQLS